MSHAPTADRGTTSRVMTMGMGSALDVVAGSLELTNTVQSTKRITRCDQSLFNQSPAS